MAAARRAFFCGNWKLNGSIAESLALATEVRNGVAALRDIARGAAVLGTGGGGDPYIGRLLAERAIAAHGPVTLVDVDEVPAGTTVVALDPERIRTRAHDLVRTSQEFLEASWATAAMGSAAPVDLGAAAYQSLLEVRDHARAVGVPADVPRTMISICGFREVTLPLSVTPTQTGRSLFVRGRRR